MKKFTLLTLLLTIISFNSQAGKGRGGQYHYYDSGVEENLKDAQTNLVSFLVDINDIHWARIFSEEISKNDYIRIIKNIKFSPSEFDRTRDNYPLVLDYIVEDGVKKIEVLGRFYDLVLYDKVSGSIEQNYIHEALHFFGYDQDEAWSKAQSIMHVYNNNFCRRMYETNIHGSCLIYNSQEDEEEINETQNFLFDWLKSGKKESLKIYSSVTVLESASSIDTEKIIELNLNGAYKVKFLDDMEGEEKELLINSPKFSSGKDNCFKDTSYGHFLCRSDFSLEGRNGLLSKKTSYHLWSFLYEESPLDKRMFQFDYSVAYSIGRKKYKPILRELPSKLLFKTLLIKPSGAIFISK